MAKQLIILASFFVSIAQSSQVTRLECAGTDHDLVTFTATFGSPTQLLNATIYSREAGELSQKDSVEADANWHPRNPAYVKYRRYDMRPSNSHGEFYYVLLPKNVSTNEFAGYLMAGDIHSGMSPTVKMNCQYR